MRLLRWADRLSEYQFDVVYRPRADKVVADLLSRYEAEPSQETPQETAILTDIFIRTVFGNAALDCLNLTDVAEATQLTTNSAWSSNTASTAGFPPIDAIRYSESTTDSLTS